MWFFFHANGYLDPVLSAAQKDTMARLFQTGWFVESLLTQTLIVHIIRTRRIPFFQSRASVPMILTTLTVMAMGVWLPYSPLATMLGLVPLPGIYWLWISGFLVSYSIITHKVKRWFLRRFEGV
jgi:Mg2+-importing ATPase